MAPSQVAVQTISQKKHRSFTHLTGDVPGTHQSVYHDVTGPVQSAHRVGRVTARPPLDPHHTHSLSGARRAASGLITSHRSRAGSQVTRHALGHGQGMKSVTSLFTNRAPVTLHDTKHLHWQESWRALRSQLLSNVSRRIL